MVEFCALVRFKRPATIRGPGPKLPRTSAPSGDCARYPNRRLVGSKKGRSGAPHSIDIFAIVSRPSMLIVSKVLAPIFDDVASSPGNSDPSDDRKDQILGSDSKAKLTLHSDFQGTRGFHHQRLRREHMLDFACADAEGEGAKSAVSCSVAVPADDRRSRQAG